MSAIVGGHPLAGREHAGPLAASADLFAGRPWAVCPSAGSSAAAIDSVRALAEACGATPVEVGIELHDRSVGLLSHLPQVVASALAGLLAPAADRGSGQIRFDLSGQGLVDTTRLAAGDATLWADILSANAVHVAPEIRSLATALHGVAEALERTTTGSDSQAAQLELLTAFLEQGQRGRELVPVKRGKAAADFATVTVDVDDRPGRLAALLTAAGEAGINVEDVRVEHVPGRPRGQIALLVRGAVAIDLSTALQANGWSVRS